MSKKVYFIKEPPSTKTDDCSVDSNSVKLSYIIYSYITSRIETLEIHKAFKVMV